MNALAQYKASYLKLIEFQKQDPEWEGKEINDLADSMDPMWYALSETEIKELEKWTAQLDRN